MISAYLNLFILDTIHSLTHPRPPPILIILANTYQTAVDRKMYACGAGIMRDVQYLSSVMLAVLLILSNIYSDGGYGPPVLSKHSQKPSG